MNGHKESIRAASFIWRNNLTKRLTWKLKDNRLWAFVYDMQLFLMNDDNGGLQAAKLWNQIEEMNSIFGDNIENIQTQFNKLSYEIYDYLGDHNDEASFKQALLLYKGVGTLQNITRAFEIWDNVIIDSVSGRFSHKNLIPAIVAKYYYYRKTLCPVPPKRPRSVRFW